MQVKKNSSLRGSRLALILSPVLWLAVLIWPAVAHSQQETRWPTHYVIVVRNTSLNLPVMLISKREFQTAIDSIPRGLEAASGQISLWRKPEPGDLISVVFAASTSPKSSGKPGCPRLDLDKYFDVRSRIDVKEGQSPSDIADTLHKNLVVEECDLIASSYSEGLTLAKGLAAVDVGDANEQEKYKQFFLLVFDFASPAYGSTEFTSNFPVSQEDLAPGTPAYFIAPIGSLKFDQGFWRLDNVNYLDYPAEEPGTTNGWFKRDREKFYPRLRFYRAVAHEASSDPFYDLADLHREVASLKEKSIMKLSIENAFVPWAATFALLMVLAWRWWAIKGRFRRMAEEHRKELQRTREEQSTLAANKERSLWESRQALAEEYRENQAALEAEKENLRSRLTSAVCIPDERNTDQASETA